MKKKSKKARRLQKEAADRKATTKAKLTIGEPFSKAKNRKILCLHYAGTPGGFVQGFCYSKLIPYSKTECICTDCRKVFPIEKYEQMKKLVHYLSNKGCMTDINRILTLSEGLEPVYYRRISENEIEIVEAVKDKCILPRHICVISS